MNRHDDLTLTDLAKRGEHTAMRIIYRKYIGQLTAVCSRYILNGEDLKDVLQESFSKIFSSIRDFDYRGEGSLKAWMTRIVVNESLHFIKDNKSLYFTPVTDDITATAVDDEPELDKVPPEVIHEFIRRLPDGYRMVFNLYVLEGKSHRETGRLLGISESTSASQLHRAKAILANQIREYINKTTL